MYAVSRVNDVNRVSSLNVRNAVAGDHEPCCAVSGKRSLSRRVDGMLVCVAPTVPCWFTSAHNRSVGSCYRAGARMPHPALLRLLCRRSAHAAPSVWAQRGARALRLARGRSGRGRAAAAHERDNTARDHTATLPSPLRHGSDSECVLQAMSWLSQTAVSARPPSPRVVSA